MIFAHIDWEIDEDCVQYGEVANPSGKGMLPSKDFRWHNSKEVPKEEVWSTCRIEYPAHILFKSLQGLLVASYTCVAHPSQFSHLQPIIPATIIAASCTSEQFEIRY